MSERESDFPTPVVTECLVVGGGIIGLSIARELARAGRDVILIDRRTTPHIASWAAGGLLPPPIKRAAHDPLEQIRGLSHELFPVWCRELEEVSGVSVELERCGGTYLGRLPGERVALKAAVEQWRADGVVVDRWTPALLADREPNLQVQEDSVEVFHLPDEVLVRTPRLIRALHSDLQSLGVRVILAEQSSWGEPMGDLPRIVSSHGDFAAENICLATGPWARELLDPLGVFLPIEPRRGQIALFKNEQRLLRTVINEGPRYLVSRADGHLLAGSTVEDVGFDGSTTATAIAELVRFARSFVPALRSLEPIASWAGLRPWSPDGVPYIGRVPRHDRVWFAGAHFRSGIHLAPATARLMRQLILDQPTDIDVSPFSLTR